jgi:hypothetical protein
MALDLKRPMDYDLVTVTNRRCKFHDLVEMAPAVIWTDNGGRGAENALIHQNVANAGQLSFCMYSNS